MNVRRFVPWTCVALVVVCVAAFEPMRGHDFVSYDDNAYVAQNPNVAGGLTGDGVAWAFTAWWCANWHPLTWLSHMLDVQLFGMNAGPHHLVTLALHAANTLLLFGALGRMTAAWGRSAFVAALFAVHPAHVESVAWLSERKDVLSTLFLLLTIWAYVAYVRRPSAGRYARVAVCFAAGLLAKPMLVTLPFQLLLLDFWPLARFPAEKPRRLVVEKLPLFAMTVASSVVTFLAQRAGGAVMPADRLPFASRVVNALVSYVSYLGKALWPTDLSILYPYDEASQGPLMAAAAAALLGIVTWIAVRERRRRPYLLFGWLWFLGTLVPVIGLVQVGIQSMADRYTYVSYVGLFVAAAWGAADLADRRVPRAAVGAAAVAVVLACAVAARRQVGYWKDSLALWTRASEVTHGNTLAQLNLGAIHWRAGRDVEAAAAYEECIRTKPTCAIAWNNLGLIRMRHEEFDDAERRFVEAVRVDPAYADAHVNLGVLLQRRGETEKAAAEYREALRANPDHGLAHVNLAAVLNDAGRTDEAIVEAQAAVRLSPSNATWRANLGLLFAKKGDLVSAAREFEAALRIDPGNAVARSELAEMGRRSGR